MRHVAAIPYPGRGHINPMLSLCRLLPSDILISFIVTEEWLGFLTAPAAAGNVRFVTIPNVIPSEIGRGKDFDGFIEAVCTKMEAAVEAAMDAMEVAVEGIMADTYLIWAVAVGSRRSVPLWSVFTMSATFFSAVYWWERIPAEARDLHVKDGVIKGEADVPLVKYIPGHNSVRLSDINDIFIAKTRNRVFEAFFMLRKAQAIIFTSCYELEPQVINALRKNLHCPIYPIGPSVPYVTLNENKNSTNANYIRWLNRQPKNSVLYVSLGSFLSVSSNQMDEIAKGLSLSGTRFLWVARSDSLRIQEMVGDEMGMVVPWCDQMTVLSHSAVGGFLTHCGWNSTMEAVFCGVPMLTFPIFWDQFVDSRLVVDEWRVGLSLRGEVGREKIILGEDIALVVKRLMDLDGDDSKETRKRAAKLRELARGAIADGGSSSKNLDSFVRSNMQGNGC